MATLLSLTSVGIGDLELFMPSPPCLVVNTFYVGGEPESSVTYVWRDESTGALRHELVYQQSAPFETALAWAEENAPTRSIERIHVRHALHTRTPARKATTRKPPKKPARKAAAKTAPASSPAKKAPAKKASAKKPSARKPPAKRRAAKKAAK